MQQTKHQLAQETYGRNKHCYQGRSKQQKVDDH
ncbi:hypothetical protein FBY33_2854 [Arthrobacter sp. SLBN-112]|jgi:hypothetical protein|nr:hypothetical protein FBY33_2854 [Arthrobacter sp. SLBN-112]